MMYYLHHLSDRFIGFNVFLYVTFRAIAAAVTAFVGTLIFGNFIIRMLTALKLGQPIRGAAEVHLLQSCMASSKARPPWEVCWLSEPFLCRVLCGRASTTDSFGWRYSAWSTSGRSASPMITLR